MPKDIRSYFSVVSKKTGDSPNAPKAKKPVSRLKDSDDEDLIAGTPEQKKSKKVPSKRTTYIISSDSEDDSNKKKPNSPLKKHKKNTENESKLKPVNVSDIFNEPVKQTKVEYVPKAEITKNKNKTPKRSPKKTKKPETEAAVHNDDDFEKTLLELDDEVILDNIDVLDKTIDEAMCQEKAETSKTSKITPKNEQTTDEKHDKKRARTSLDKATPNKKPKLEHTDSGIDPDQERFEKKQYSAMLYQKYLQRSGPKHRGEKEIPKGKPDCLNNLTFLRTGVLDSLESEEFESLIKEHGGRVVHGISKKVNYVVVGEDPGPSKLEKARNYKIPEISEDDLLDMILVKSGMQSKFVKNHSDDTGVGSDTESFSSDKIVKEEKKSPKKIQIKTEKTTPEKTIKIESQNYDIKQIKTEKMDFKPVEISPSSMTWTEKYKPADLKAIIGQQDGKSNMSKLIHWLSRWETNQKPEVKQKLPRPTPWNQYDGAYFKCTLLSGPPGVGKTTTATLVAKHLGYDVVEFNASDTRNQKLLHQEVSQLLKTKTIAGFASGEQTTNKKRVLLMDEVDGMAGNEDRGGIKELINLIKTTNIPIICMANDRNHQKMRTLVTYCYDLKFTKPPVQQIRGAMLSICYKEGIQIKPDALTELITGTGCDIRQTLNHLSMWSAGTGTLSMETVQKESKSSQKDTVLGIWDVIRKVFTDTDQKNMSIHDKARLFFFDYSMGPVFVQENYLNVAPNCRGNREELRRCFGAIDSLSRGDLIESKIRSSNNWSLLEVQAFFSSVFPGYYMAGTVKKINFPAWFGKNSKQSKHDRILSELYSHTRTCTSGNKTAMQLDYTVPLRDAIINPLKSQGAQGVHQAIEVMKSYSLLREDLTNLVELCHWSDTKNPFDSIDSKVKAAFTRAYNKDAPMLSFAPTTAKKKTATVEDDLLDEEDNFDTDVEDDDVSKDAMIKVKTSKDKKSGGTTKAKDGKTESKAKGRTKKK